MNKKGSRIKVFRGTADSTVGGLGQGDLKRSKFGKIVSSKKSALARKKYKTAGSGLNKWSGAYKKARGELGVTGFVPPKKGTELYKLTRKYYDAA